MKPILVVVAFLTVLYLRAEENYKIYYEKAEHGYNIFVDNSEYCPISIEVNFTVQNLEIENGNNKTYIIKPSTTKELITKLTIINKTGAYGFSYSYSENVGDVLQDIYDKEFKYYLPFKKSTSYTIYQGYNGTFSHQNENSLDFTMPVGTPITAIRKGVVTKVIEKNNKNCGQEKCMKYNNYICIYHKDGTFVEYAHIKQNGSIVNVGDKVEQGQLIGYSGNVGYSTGPHLHLVVFFQKMKSRTTLKTKFLVSDNALIYLKEKETYSRDY